MTTREDLEKRNQKVREQLQKFTFILVRSRSIIKTVPKRTRGQGGDLEKEYLRLDGHVSQSYWRW